MPDNNGPPEQTLTLDDAIAQLDAILTSHFDSLDNADAPTADLDAVASVIKFARQLNKGNGKSPATRRPSLAQLSKAAESHPTRKRASMAASLTASVHIPTGEPEIVQALFNALRQPGRLAMDTPVVIASAQWTYPQEQQLPDDDPGLTAAIMQRAIRNMVAYGGICEPVAVDYSIPSFTSEARPIRDGLPSFEATRGGVRFSMPFKLSDTAGGVTVWTQAMDTGGTATKNVSTLTCPNPQEQVVYGIATRTKMGNMQERYNPELVQAWLDTTNAAAARNAELALLSAIETGSTAVTYAGHGLGAARELLPVLDQAAAGLRYRHRATRESPVIRTIMPDFVKDLLRADVAKELAHSNDPNADALALAEQRIDAWFAAKNISPIWGLESTTAPPFNVQAAGALAAWPTSILVKLFHDGTWVFLDGGRLDVGLIRDSTLNAQNNVEMFTEVFEAVAFRGLESVAITVPLNPTGASSSGVIPT
jgi:hypothetical protein